MICGAVSGLLKDNLILSTVFIMSIGHRKEIGKLTFRALALRRSETREWFIYRKMELCYRLVPGNVKNNRIN